jgi:hypothetical protein
MAVVWSSNKLKDKQIPVLPGFIWLTALSLKSVLWMASNRVESHNSPTLNHRAPSRMNQNWGSFLSKKQNRIWLEGDTANLSITDLFEVGN